LKSLAAKVETKNERGSQETRPQRDEDELAGAFDLSSPNFIERITVVDVLQ
jgi:hypothetical protein